MKVQKLVIQGKLDGLNELIYSNRSSKYAGASLKIKNEKVVQKYIKECCLMPVSNYPVRIAIDWYEKDMRRDLDNIISAKKFIFDALVHEKILTKDGRKQIDEIIKENVIVDKENPRIEVCIYEK